MSTEKNNSAGDDEASLMRLPMRPVFCYLAVGLATAYLFIALALVGGAILKFHSIGWWGFCALPIAYTAFINSVSLFTKARYDLHHRKDS